jgi:protein-tyrosine phosphatase
MSQRKAKTVLFLCTGNYYRSRFAEILFNSVASKMGLPWQASSEGLALERGVNNVGPMAVLAVKALEAMGVRAAEAVARFPVQVTTEDLERADRIVALKQAEHVPLLQERFPAWVEKVEFCHVDDVPEVLALTEVESQRLLRAASANRRRFHASGKKRKLYPSDLKRVQWPSASLRWKMVLIFLRFTGCRPADQALAGHGLDVPAELTALLDPGPEAGPD